MKSLCLGDAGVSADLGLSPPAVASPELTCSPWCSLLVIGGVTLHLQRAAKTGRQHVALYRRTRPVQEDKSPRNRHCSFTCGKPNPTKPQCLDASGFWGFFLLATSSFLSCCLTSVQGLRNMQKRQWTSSWTQQVSDTLRNYSDATCTLPSGDRHQNSYWLTLAFVLPYPK